MEKEQEICILPAPANCEHRRYSPDLEEYIPIGGSSSCDKCQFNKKMLIKTQIHKL